jgi:hypothetical protein
MALTAEELEQIRGVVRSEISKPSRDAWKIVLIVFAASFAMFIAVIGLHVLVIGGFTIYHLMQH